MKSYINRKIASLKAYIQFLKKSFMTVSPLNKVQSHATKMQTIGFKAVRLVRNTLVVAFSLGIISGAAYSGFKYAVNYGYATKMVYANVITPVKVQPQISDFPILVRVCNAESGGVQFLKNGNVVRGVVNPSDIGKCQINEAINNDEARKLGYDIFTEKGNEDMAIHLFVNQGTRPWNSSKCIKNGWGTTAECAVNK